MTDRPRITVDLTNPTLQAEMVTLQQRLRELAADWDKLIIAAIRQNAAREMLDHKGNA